MPGVWGLHGVLIEALLDLAGLDEDAPGRAVSIAPVLPPDWPHLGQRAVLSCGRLGYLYERAGRAGGRLHLESHLVHPVTLTVALPVDGPTPPRGWTSPIPGPAPAFDPATRQLRWSVTLPEGESRGLWSWGDADPPNP
jgi:hypothetical protein